jgi:hypothetical protein
VPFISNGPRRGAALGWAGGEVRLPVLPGPRLGQIGTSPGLHWTDGPTQIDVLVLEPYELKPYPGGAEILIEQYKYRTIGFWQFSEVARGRTDQEGRFSFSGMAPLPTRDYKYRVTLLSPVEGDPKSFHVPARDAISQAMANGKVSFSEVEIAACPPGSDSFVCAVADSQLSWKAAYEQQLRAWAGAAANQPLDPHIPRYGDSRFAGGAGLAATTAAVEVKLKHPTLIKHMALFRWWLGDLGVPPKDWPDLVKNYEQMIEIFDRVPFPRYPGIESYFKDCCRSVPLTQDRDGRNRAMNDPRLYSKTWCDYFPKESAAIEQNMAVFYSSEVALQTIFLCVIERSQRRIEQLKREIRGLVMLSLVLTALFAPAFVLAGPGGIAAFATTTADLVAAATQGNQIVGQGTTLAIAAGISLAGDLTLVTAALGPIFNALLEGMDPVAAQAIRMVAPNIIESALGALATPAQAMANPIAGIVGSLANVGLTMAVQTLVTLPMLAVKKVAKELQSIVAGVEAVTSDLQAMVSKESVSPELRDWFVWVGEKIGYEDFINRVIDQFLDEVADAMNDAANQGGGVDVVPREGGGATIVPTDPSGVPTDAFGNPLPGGMAPPLELPGPSTVTAVVGTGAVALLFAAGAVLS